MATQEFQCGFLGDRRRACSCTPREVDAYRSRISGPLLDRIDLHVEVPALAYEALAGAPTGEGTPAVRARVARARALQCGRLAGSALYCNAQMGSREVIEHCRHHEGCARLRSGAQGRAGNRGLGKPSRRSARRMLRKRSSSGSGLNAPDSLAGCPGAP